MVYSLCIVLQRSDASADALHKGKYSSFYSLEDVII